jgi:error-prone DNA polymerase
MGGHRSHEQMERLRRRFIAGAGARGVTEEIAAELFHQLEGFASYGFPESHAAAFAKIVYDSAYLKLYYPTEFYCALLNNWPMGFYPPAVIVGDARRHGVPVLPVDVNRGRADCTVEGRSVRIGFRYVRGIGETWHEVLDAASEAGPFMSLHDFCRRTRLDRDAVANLIDVGAFDSLGTPRRQLLWQLPEALKAARDDEIDGLVVVSRNPPLHEPTAIEEARSDYHVLGLPASHHVMEFYRSRLDDMRVLTCVELGGLPDGSWVRVGGVVICRQAPGTAHGHVFLTIEDETGLGNVIVRPKVYAEYRLTIRHQLVLVVEGRLQNQDRAVSVLAKRVDSLNPEFTEGLFVRSFR